MIQILSTVNSLGDHTEIQRGLSASVSLDSYVANNCNKDLLFEYRIRVFDVRKGKEWVRDPQASFTVDKI